MKSELNKKRGKFSISRKLIDEASPLLFEFFSNLVIFRAEMMYVNDTIEYCGYSELFEDCNEGQEMPDYDIIYDTNLKYYRAMKWDYSISYDDNQIILRHAETLNFEENEKEN